MYSGSMKLEVVYSGSNFDGEIISKKFRTSGYFDRWDLDW